MHALLITLAFALSSGASAEIAFQAHRGAVDEAPENTLAALQLAWGVPGAVPEVDLQTSSDGAIVCIHDDTPARTTNAPQAWRDKKIGEIPLACLREWDAGMWFAPEFAGEKVPTLDEVLVLLKSQEDRQIYLDLKQVDVAQLAQRLLAEGVAERVVFVHGDPAECLRLSRLYPGARTMTWLSAAPRTIEAGFKALQEAGFPGLWQLQFHLRPGRKSSPWPFALEEGFLREAVQQMKAAGVVPQARLFELEPEILRTACGLGFRWFVTDAPSAFYAAVKEAFESAGAPE